MSRLLLGTLVILGSVANGLAQDGVAPWPLERQDRWGTGRALVGPPAAEMTTPWVDKRIITSALVSHGASLGPGGIGYFGNWQGHLVYKIDYNGNILGAFDALHHVRSTPAIGLDGQVFASTGEEGFNPGRVFAINTAIMDYNWFKDVGWMGGSPTLGPDGDVVTATGSGRAIRWDNETGATVWERTGLGPARATVVFSRDDQLVFVAHGNKISAFTYDHGRPAWTVDLGAPAGSPGVAPDGTVVVGAQSGLVYALDPVDGETNWTWQTLNGVRGAPAFSDNGLAYVGSNDHRLYALRISDGLREWSFTSTGPINNPPVVDAIGLIYFHNQAKDIFCILPSGHEEWRAHMGALSRGVMTIGPRLWTRCRVP
jgi:outer membrane protein assembly factor BamB